MKWINALKSGFLRNSLYCLYLFVLLLVCIGIFASTGAKYVPLVALFFSTFTLSYFLFKRVKDLFFIERFKAFLERFFDQRKSLYKYVIWGLFFFTIGFIIFHFIFLKNIPVIKAYYSLDYYGIAYIRQAIGEHDSVAVKYISSFIIKGFLPFLIVYFYLRHKKWFVVILLFGVFYAIALMQKGLIVTVLFPLVVYTFLDRKYLSSLLYLGLAIGGVYLLFYITNPDLRASHGEITVATEDSPYEYENTTVVDTLVNAVEESAVEDVDVGKNFQIASSGIFERIFYTTGMVSTYWFENIPKKYPHAGWCGYHFIAPFLGCDFQDYNFSRIIYDEVYPHNAAKGFTGTVTVASFVYDYACFGYPGVAVSGVVLALFFLVIERIFSNNHKWIISLNFLNVFWLSSAALSTLILSGGWFFTMVLYLICENDIKKSIS